MKLFLKDELLRIPNTTPEKPFSKIIIADAETCCNDSACALLIIPPKSALPLHYHKARETWLFMVEGEMEETVGEETFTLKSGDTVFIAPNELHGSVNNSEHEVRFVEAWTRPQIEPDFYLPET